MKTPQRSRLKRRINAYRTLGYNFVYMLETDFKGVFSPMMTKKEIETAKQGWGFGLNELIEKCSEEECMELNQRLDCYQLDKKYD